MIRDNQKFNPLSAEWKSKVSKQSDSVKQQLLEFKKQKSKDYQLNVIKRSKIDPKKGDVFLLSPRNGIYFYGKVLKTNIEHKDKDGFIHGRNVVAIFNCKTKELDLSDYSPSYNDLLIRIMIIDSSYWFKGYFHTIDNIPLTKEEQKLDYGFYRISRGQYLKEDGRELKRKPKVLGVYGIVTLVGVARKIEKELIIDPSLLEF